MLLNLNLQQNCARPISESRSCRCVPIRQLLLSQVRPLPDAWLTWLFMARHLPMSFDCFSSRTCPGVAVLTPGWWHYLDVCLEAVSIGDGSAPDGAVVVKRDTVWCFTELRPASDHRRCVRHSYPDGRLEPLASIQYDSTDQ